jgi:hypothetical protein
MYWMAEDEDEDDEEDIRLVQFGKNEERNEPDPTLTEFPVRVGSK